jgi:hypothetical protein
MRLSMLFIWRRREGIQYHRGETVDGEWNSSMLPDDASIFLGLGGALKMKDQSDRTTHEDDSPICSI